MSQKIQTASIITRELNAVDYAALTVASRPWDKVRDELPEGSHTVYGKLIVTGGVSIGRATSSTGPCDYQGVLAYILARLSDNQKAFVREAIVHPAFSVSKAERDVAKAFCEPTQKTIQRRGALTGSIEVSAIR